MNVTEIIAQVGLLTEESYADADWIRLINGGLDDLTPYAKMATFKEGIAVTLSGGGAIIDISADTDLVKAHEFKAVYFKPTGGSYRPLRRLVLSNLLAEGWKLDADSVLLQGLGAAGGADVVRVDYYKKLAHVSIVGDIPELPEQYHPLLVLFAATKSQQKEEELPDKNDFFVEYIEGRKQFAFDRLWEMEPDKKRLIQGGRLGPVSFNVGQQQG